MTKPRLSVVVPVYNRPEEARRAVASVLEQSFDALEIVVVDDASTEPLRRENFPASGVPVQIVRHETNSGAAAARNTGMAAANGMWIAFLDSDDIWLPGSLTRRFQIAERALANGITARTVFVAGFKLHRIAQGSTEGVEPRDSGDPLDFASGCWFAPGSTALFLRDQILGAVGGQDETLRRFEDNDWFLRLALSGGQVISADGYAAEVNVSGKPSLDAVTQSGRAMLRKYETFEMEPALRPQVMRRLKAWHALECASVHWYGDRKLHALADIARSLWHVPRLRLHPQAFWQRRAQLR